MAITEVMSPSEMGMAYQKMRVDAATINIANANVVQPTDGSGFKPLSVALSVSHFDQLLTGQATPEMVAVDVPDKLLFQPEHPASDTSGYVHYANIDLAQQMVTLNDATRAYEANVKAFNAQMSMALKAMEIGK